MIEAELVALVTGNADVAAIVSDRMYPLYLPQKPTYPCIVYRKTDDKPISLLANDTNIQETRFDIGAFSKNHDTSADLINKIKISVQRAVIDPIMDITIEGADSDFEPNYEIHEATLEVLITHRV